MTPPQHARTLFRPPMPCTGDAATPPSGGEATAGTVRRQSGTGRLAALTVPAALIAILVLPGVARACPSGPAAHHAPATGTPALASRGGTPCAGRYTVQAGDTLYDIAARCGVALAALRSANPGSELLAVGRVLVIPGGTDLAAPPSVAVRPQGGSPCAGRYVVRAGDTLYDIAAHCGVALAVLRRANSGSEVLAVGRVLVVPGSGRVQPAPASQTVAGGHWYVVRAGDTLSAIALRYRVGVGTLMGLNGLHSADQLAIGQTLKVPSVG